MSIRQGYKQTDTEEIPEEWAIRKLGDKPVTRLMKAGGTPLRTRKEYYKNGTIPFVRIGDITTAGKYLNKTELKITEKGLNNSTTWLVPNKSILYSMYASYGEATINTIPVATNQAIIAILRSENVDLEYLYYSLNQIKMSLYKYLRTTTQKNLNAKIVKNLKIPIPPLVEQQGIARILSCVDETIQKTEEVIERTEMLKRGLMQRLLTQGIGHHRFKKWGTCNVPIDREIVKLENAIEFIRSGISRELSSRNIGYAVIRSTNIQDDKLDLSDIKYWHLIDPKGANLKDYILDNGDLLVNFINSLGQIGKCCIFSAPNRDCIYTTNIFRIKLNENFLTHNYFHYFAQTFMYKKQVFSITKPAVQQASFTQKDFKKIETPVPPIPEQQKICKLLSTVDKKLEHERNSKEKLSRIKKGLMSDLLKGNVRVKVN